MQNVTIQILWIFRQPVCFHAKVQESYGTLRHLYIDLHVGKTCYHYGTTDLCGIDTLELMILLFWSIPCWNELDWNLLETNLSLLFFLLNLETKTRNNFCPQSTWYCLNQARFMNNLPTCGQQKSFFHNCLPYNPWKKHMIT